MPDDGRFDLDLRARGAAGGLLSRLTGLKRGLALDVGGDGGWERWNGRAVLDAGGERIADLALGNRGGDYTLIGTVEPGSVTRGKLQALTAPRVTVNGAGTFVQRRLAGTLSLRSAALAVTADGAADFGTSALRNLKLRARLLRPEALFRNMRATNMEMRAILDGPFKSFRFDYRLTSPCFSFDQTGFEVARAAGRGRWSRSP
ncbi:hypothetical protein AB5I41_11745 [Sphingomonas sp. MMS24-JH45]